MAEYCEQHIRYECNKAKLLNSPSKWQVIIYHCVFLSYSLYFHPSSFPSLPPHFASLFWLLFVCMFWLLFVCCLYLEFINCFFVVCICPDVKLAWFIWFMLFQIQTHNHFFISSCLFVIPMIIILIVYLPDWIVPLDGDPYGWWVSHNDQKMVSWGGAAPGTGKVCFISSENIASYCLFWLRIMCPTQLLNECNSSSLHLKKNLLEHFLFCWVPSVHAVCLKPATTKRNGATVMPTTHQIK